MNGTASCPPLFFLLFLNRKWVEFVDDYVNSEKWV